MRDVGMQAPQAAQCVEIDRSEPLGRGRSCPVAALPADAALGARRETLRSSALGHLKTVWVHFSRLPKAIIAWVKGLLEDNTLKKQEKVLNACSMDLLSAAALSALNPMSWRTQYLEVFEGKNELARLINGLRATKEHADSAALRNEAERLLECVFSRSIQDMLHQCHQVTEAEVAQSKLADLDYWRDLAISVQKVPIEVLGLRKQMLLFSMSFGRGAVDMTPSNVDGLPALCAFA